MSRGDILLIMDTDDLLGKNHFLACLAPLWQPMQISLLLVLHTTMIAFRNSRPVAPSNYELLTSSMETVNRALSPSTALSLSNRGEAFFCIFDSFSTIS